MTALDRATQARLAGVFVSEAEETLSTLGAALERLRASADPEALATFGRSAHGLKGAAASIGFDGLARALHDLEAVALRLGDPGTHAAVHGRVSAALQLLMQVVQQMAASGRQEPPADTVQRLLLLLGEEAATPRGPAASAAVSPPAAHPSVASAAESPGSVPAPDPATLRLSVPAAEVDEALRLAASLARGITLLQEAQARDGGVLSGLQSLGTAAERLEATIAGLRMLPADAALSGLESEAAQLAGLLGKRAELVVSGRDVHADRRSLQAARVMIRHLLRNALDHGIEKPEQRVAAGKPAAGRIAVRLDTVESSLRVGVEDDGAGFDLPAIRAEMARRRGDAEAIAQLPDTEVLQLFAFAGGSTRATATEVSGRGLGLSAVAGMARAAGGGIEIRSERGAGSRIDFMLPLDLYAVEVLVTKACGRVLGIPIRSVRRKIHLRAVKDAVHQGPGGLTLAADEALLPLRDLGRLLDGAAPPREIPPFAAVVHDEGSAAAFAVEDVGTVIGVVPMTVPGLAEPGRLVSGVVQLANGTVLEILNPKRLLPLARASQRTADVPAPPRTDKALLEVVLAEDSLATREVLRVLLEQQGFRVRLAADGEEALARIAERAPDVLVSDVNMPRRDGLWLTRQLRARPDTARLPVVLLTSLDDDASRAAGAAAGADAYLVKSQFNAAVLTDALARIGVRARR